LNIGYWHFIEYVEKGSIDIQSVKSRDRIPNILTKPMPEAKFFRLRDIILGIQLNHNTSTFQGCVKNKITPMVGNGKGKIGSTERDKGL